MDTNRIMVIAEKESFLVRVLLKKISDTGIEGVFVPFKIDDINQAWAGTALITVYIESNITPPKDVIRFLADKMTDSGMKMILIGDRTDLDEVKKDIHGNLIHEVFERPLDNEKYIKSVSEVFDKIKKGDDKKSILIVDDDANYLNLVRQWLAGKYKVSMVTSGLQAIKWLGMNKADLILLDYEMPVTSGPKVLEMLRSDDDMKNIPVIFLTGKSDKESVMAVLSLKPEGYFLKNIEKDELLDKLNEFFILQ